MSDWRVRWATVILTLLITAFGIVRGYQSLIEQVKSVSAQVEDIKKDLSNPDKYPNTKQVTRLEARLDSLEKVLTEHIAQPMHPATREFMGSINARMVNVEEGVGRIEAKVDRVLMRR